MAGKFNKHVMVINQDLFHNTTYLGGEPLLDCAWVNSQIHCIHQKGVTRQTPVSNTVAITIPRLFLNRTGSYKCVPEGYKHDKITECRFSSTQGNKPYTTTLTTLNKEVLFKGLALSGSAMLVSRISVVIVSVSKAITAFLL